jgi:hypothetical protein
MKLINPGRGMRRRLTLLAVGVALVAFTGSAVAGGSLLRGTAKTDAAGPAKTEVATPSAALLGVWDAIDPSAGIPRVILRPNGTGVFVQVFGACSPSWCDWGVASGFAYAKNVSSPSATAFTATYDQGFAERIVTGKLKRGKLTVDVFSHFKDGSGRSDYFVTYKYAKS